MHHKTTQSVKLNAYLTKKNCYLEFVLRGCKF